MASPGRRELWRRRRRIDHLRDEAHLRRAKLDRTSAHRPRVDNSPMIEHPADHIDHRAVRLQPNEHGTYLPVTPARERLTAMGLTSARHVCDFYGTRTMSPGSMSKLCLTDS